MWCSWWPFVSTPPPSRLAPDFDAVWPSPRISCIIENVPTNIICGLVDLNQSLLESSNCKCMQRTSLLKYVIDNEKQRPSMLCTQLVWPLHGFTHILCVSCSRARLLLTTQCDTVSVFWKKQHICFPWGWTLGFGTPLPACAPNPTLAHFSELPCSGASLVVSVHSEIGI